MEFSELNIRQTLIERLRKSGIVSPTPVQERTVPVLMDGKDAIVQAQTGTGKTIAFILPILEKIDPAAAEIQALVVTPTRELAIQISGEFRKLAPAVGAGALAVYGGQDVEAQVRKLRGAAHIVVATPGRLLDHLRRRTIDLSRVSMLVLDEADQMLDMGFFPEVEEIIRRTSRRRQTMLFSATMPDSVRTLARDTMKSPQDIRVREGREVTLQGIRQQVVDVSDRTRQATLIRLIEAYRPYLAVVFCRTKIRAKKLTEVLAASGMNVDELHGDLSQAKRELVMRRFREAKLQILVATDVAARGVDIEGVTHVFNYDVPLDAEYYIHRIGRTGRAGHTGMAITLAAPKDGFLLQKIEKGIGQKLEHRTLEEQPSGRGARPAGGQAKKQGKPSSKPRGRKPVSKPGVRPAAKPKPRSGKDGGKGRGSRSRTR